MKDVENPHAREVEEVLEALDVEAGEGLSEEEVRRRREQAGPNRLREAERRSAWAILAAQFRSIVVAILAAAAVLGYAVGHVAEGTAVVAVIAVNTLIGFLSEWKAIRSMEALRERGAVTVRVRRGGGPEEIEAENLVPGDVVTIEPGDIVPADLRLLEANRLRLKEAALTGESVPVSKTVDPVDADAPAADRTDMLFRGTTVTEGSGEGVVVATGMETELGRISEMAEEAESERTPLERRLNRLGGRLAWITLGLAAAVAGAGLVAGQPTLLMIKTAIALGVAAIPEGLPIVATIALARGLWLMARQNALTNRLMSVETLGATTVILVDKTGTLTENRMTLRQAVTDAGEHTFGDEGEAPPEGSLIERLVELGVLCNNAELADSGGDGEPDVQSGDPTEVALLRAGRRYGLARPRLLEDRPERREVAFDPDVMMMATFHASGDGLEVAVKGAPGAVLEVSDRLATGDGERDLSDEDRRAWGETAGQMASGGLRVLAMADRRADSTDEDPYANLRLVGLVGLVDPPRDGAAEAIEACRAAGVRVVMVTGDQPETARAVAREVGLAGEAAEDDAVLHGRDLADLEELEDVEDLAEARRREVVDVSIFARVSPAQKLNLLRLFQASGETVAMTGDGINDAPALKRADIGVAMGRRGTDAARQVADMVLQDDAFETIVAAVRQGRIIFANIRKSVMFMLCTNVAEVTAVTAASLAAAPLPLRPLQILYLNVITDVFPALALGLGKGDPRVMDRPPRDPDEPVLTRRHWGAVGVWSVLIAACVLGALATGFVHLGFEEKAAVTLSFLTLGFAKLGFTFNLRDPGTRLLSNDVVRNPWVWGALALCTGLLLLAVYLPGLSLLLQTAPPGWDGWLTILGLAAVPAIVGQVLRLVQRLRQKTK